MKVIRLLLLLAIGMPAALPAQSLWEFGFQAGATAYAGDLTPHKMVDAKMTSPAAGIFVSRQIIPDLSLRLNLLGGQIAGDEAHFDDPNWRQLRAFSFRTDFIESDLLLQWELLAHRRTADLSFHRVLSPYLFVGPGAVYYQPSTNFNNSAEPNPVGLDEQIAVDRNAMRQASVSFAWVMGGGWRYDLGHKWLLGIELGVRNIQTDYLDGVSHSGNPDAKDWFVCGNLTLTRRLFQTDTDRDFIPNKFDHCPLLPGPRRMRGCPDADGDRITDAEDECPLVPGLLSARGCPDADGDGVQDSLDVCPQIKGSVAAGGCPDRDADGTADQDDPCPDNSGPKNLKGCPDVDGDGLADIYDACPEVAGSQAAQGCPDADSDGIVDTDDQCPELAGLVAFKGCPDTDEDGVMDKEDACPILAGLQVFKGCPDTDGDAIPDPDDKCPNQKGLAAFAGCPDTDGDGLPDQDDACPALKGAIAAQGCPEISQEDKKAMDLAVKKIQFESGADVLTVASFPILDQLVVMLEKYPNYKAVFQGHTDSAGSASKNLDLSNRRALRCQTYLVEKGIAAERLSAEGFGASKPIASNKNAAGRAKNRRVELNLTKL